MEAQHAAAEAWAVESQKAGEKDSTPAIAAKSSREAALAPKTPKV